jgi:hypothetical protein
MTIGQVHFSMQRGSVFLIFLAFPLVWFSAATLCLGTSSLAELMTTVSDEEARRLPIDDLPSPKNHRPGSVFRATFVPPRLAPGKREVKMARASGMAFAWLLLMRAEGKS